MRSVSCQEGRFGGGAEGVMQHHNVAQEVILGYEGQNELFSYFWAPGAVKSYCAANGRQEREGGARTTQ